MSNQRLFYQPPWIEFTIFWSVIVVGISLAVIVQSETTHLSWLSIAIAVLTVIVAIIHVISHRLIIDDSGLHFRSVFKSNRLDLQFSDIHGFTEKKFTLILKTKSLGQLQFLIWRRQSRQMVENAIASHAN